LSASVKTGSRCKSGHSLPRILEADPLHLGRQASRAVRGPIAPELAWPLGGLRGRRAANNPVAICAKQKLIVLGLLSTKVPELEERPALRRRLDEATKFVALHLSFMRFLVQ